MELRLNKLISDSGLCSRREADTFIEQGRVTVNGKLPEVGQKVTEQDVVMVDGFQLNMNDHTGGGKTRAISGKAKNLMFGDTPLKRESLTANRENAAKEAAERKLSDRKPTDRKPADRKPAERKSASQKPSDQKPFARKAEERQSEDRKPTDRKPFDKKPALNKPVVRKSADWEEEDAVKFEKRPGKFVKYNKYAAARHAARDGGSPKPASASKENPDEARLLKEARNPKFKKSLGRSAVAQRMGAAPKSASLRKSSKNNPVNKAKRVDRRTKSKDE